MCFYEMISLMLSILCCLIFLLSSLSWVSVLRNKLSHNVGGPFPLPVIGNAHLFLVQQTEFLNLLHRLSKTYGGAYLVYLLSVPLVIISHPKYIEPIVTSTELITKGQSYKFIRPWMGNGLLTSTGQRWKSHRKFLTPAFHFNILQNFLPVFCKNGRILANKLETLDDGQDLFPLVALAALDNTTESIMGLCVDSQKNTDSEYVKSIQTISRIISRRMQVPFLASDFIFNLTSDKNKQDRAIRFLHNYTRKVIATRRDELKNVKIKNNIQKSNDYGMKNRCAFLDSLLLSDKYGVNIDEESICEEVDTFMFAGHDTTTSGICFNLYCIANNSNVQEKILQEQASIFGDDMERDPTIKEINQMKYLEMAIKETLRLYPAVPLMERMMMRDIEIGDLKIKRGTSIAINTFQVQRDPDLFKDPLEYRPERFDANSSESRNVFGFLAFSAGPRNCIGQKYAMLAMKATLSLLVRRFQLVSGGEEPQLRALLTLSSDNGVKVNFRRRKFT